MHFPTVSILQCADSGQGAFVYEKNIQVELIAWDVCHASLYLHLNDNNNCYAALHVN